MARPALILSAVVVALPVALLAPPGASAATARWSGSATGTLAFVNAADVGSTDLGRVGLGQAASGAQSAAPVLVQHDALRQPLLVASGTGRTAFAHASGLNAGLLSSTSTPPQLAQTLAEATSPAPSTRSGDLLALPVDPLLSATVLPSAVVARSTSQSPCGTGDQAVSEATSLVAQATALAGLVTVGGTSETVTGTRVVGRSLESTSTQTLAPITVLAGTPAALTITVLGPVQLRTRAGGTGGSSLVSYGIPGKSGTDPVVTLSAAGHTSSLTAQQVFGAGGVVLPLGIADLTLGAPVHARTGLEGTSPSAAADGTEASAAADLVRLIVPGALATPGQDPLDGPLAPLNAVLNPVLAAVDPLLSALQTTLTNAGLGVADVRLGHQEAGVAVPVGGITCGAAGNPLSESRKDASATGVGAGQTFDYTIRVPNRGTTALTDVVVQDTWTGGQSLVRAVPSSTSRGTTSARFALGTLTSGAFRTVVLTFRAPDGLGVALHNYAVITAHQPDGSTVTVPVDAEGPTTTAVPAGPCDLSASTTWSSNKRVLPGERFAYVVDVLNSGGQACRSVTITDPLDPGVTFVSCTAHCTHTGRDVTWVVGPLGPGASTTVIAVVSTTATSGTLGNTATVTPTSGRSGHPTVVGPVVTTQSVVQAGHPPVLAGVTALPRRDLPTTGLPAPVAVVALVLLGTGLVLRRRTS